MTGKQRGAADHPDKEIRKALKEILDMAGEVTFKLTQAGHWGTLYCSKGCCKIAVNGTPRNAANHARDLLREARKCPRKDGDVRKSPPRAVAKRSSPSRLFKRGK